MLKILQARLQQYVNRELPKYLLTDYLVPSSVLDTRETMETKIDVIPVQEG